LLYSVRLQPTHIINFEFNPAEFMLAAVTSAKTVRIWDLEVMKQIGCTYPDASLIKGIAFHPHDSALCTATNDSAKMWHWEPVKMSAHVSIPWEGICDLHISPDTNTLLSASSVSNVVTLWSVDTERMAEDGISKAARLNQRENTAAPASGGKSNLNFNPNTPSSGGKKIKSDVLLPTRSPGISRSIYLSIY
jgi:WD40 repeat protein